MHHYHDKIILLILYVIGVVVLLHVIHHEVQNERIIDFITAQIAGFSGALLILITGRGGSVPTSTSKKEGE